MNSRLHPRLATPSPHVTKYPSPQVLVDSPLTNRDAVTPLDPLLRKMRGVSASSNCQTINLPTFSDLSLFLSPSCALFCTFLHTSKNQPLYFQAIPHSASKNRALQDTFRNLSLGFRMNQVRANSRAVNDPTGCVRRHFTRDRCEPHSRFASHPCSFLLNYIDPILHRVGPTGRFPHSTPRPRS